MATPKRRYQQVSYAKWNDPALSTLKTAGSGSVAGGAANPFALQFSIPDAGPAKPFTYLRRIVPQDVPKQGAESEAKGPPENTSTQDPEADTMQKQDHEFEKPGTDAAPVENGEEKDKETDKTEEKTERDDDSPKGSEDSTSTEIKIEPEPLSEAKAAADNTISDPSGDDNFDDEHEKSDAPEEAHGQKQNDAESGETTETTVEAPEPAEGAGSESKTTLESSSVDQQPVQDPVEESLLTSEVVKEDVATTEPAPKFPSWAEDSSAESSDSLPRSPTKISFAADVTDGKPHKSKRTTKTSGGSKPSKPKAKREARLRELRLAESNDKTTQKDEARSEDEAVSEELAHETSETPTASALSDASKGAESEEKLKAPANGSETVVAEDTAESKAEGIIEVENDDGATVGVDEQTLDDSTQDDIKELKKVEEVIEVVTSSESPLDNVASTKREAPGSGDKNKEPTCEELVAELPNTREAEKPSKNKKTKENVKKKTKSKDKAAPESVASETASEEKAQDRLDNVAAAVLAPKSEMPEDANETKVDSSTTAASPAEATMQNTNGEGESGEGANVEEMKGEELSNEKEGDRPEAASQKEEDMERVDDAKDAAITDAVNHSEKEQEKEQQEEEKVVADGTERIDKSSASESKTGETLVMGQNEESVKNTIKVEENLDANNPPTSDNEAKLEGDKGPAAEDSGDVAAQTDIAAESVHNEEAVPEEIPAADESVADKAIMEQKSAEEPLAADSAKDPVLETELASPSTDPTLVESSQVEARLEEPPPSPTLSKRSARRSNEHAQADRWTRPHVRGSKAKDRSMRHESPPKSPQKASGGRWGLIRAHRSSTDDEEERTLAWAKQMRQNATFAAEEEERKAKKESKRAAQVKMELRKAEEAEEKRLAQAKRRKERREEIDRLIEGSKAYGAKERDVSRQTAPIGPPPLATAEEGQVRRHRRRGLSAEDTAAESKHTSTKRPRADKTGSENRSRHHRHGHHKRESSEQNLNGSGHRPRSPAEQEQPHSTRRAQSERHSADRPKKRRRSDADDKKGRPRRNSAETPVKSLWQGLRKALAVTVT